MISIVKNLFKNELIYETLIDKIFNNIESKEIYSEEFLDQLINNLIDNNINIELKISKFNNVNGKITQIGPNNYLITIFHPDNLSNDQQKLILLTLLHEYSHIITYKKISPLIQIKKKGIPLEKYIKTYDFDMFGFNNDFDIETSKRFLNYVFHPAELNNWAASFAISFFLDPSNNNSIEDLVIINNNIINKYLNNKIKLYEYRDKLYTDLKLLFEVQLSVKYLNLKEYNQMFVKLIKRVIKYDKRIRKLFQ